jgi:hypothetical protein
VRIRRLLITSALVVSQLTLFAQRSTPTASELKAAYLYQFRQYVAWPAAPDNFTICVVGDDAVAAGLEKLTQDDARAGKVGVRRGAPAAGAASCQVLFIGGDEPMPADLVKTVAGEPTLLVGEDAAFLRIGGMIAFIPQGQRIRFSVNLAAAQAAHLRVSSQLLKLAVTVIR